MDGIHLFGSLNLVIILSSKKCDFLALDKVGEVFISGWGYVSRIELLAEK